MTTIYVPRLIESAEQAEALPSGTVATYGEGSMTLTAHRVTSIAVKPDAWNGMDDLLSSIDMVGWTALVPIEAEEETGIRDGKYVDQVPSDYPREAMEDHWSLTTRLVTPWEEA